MRIIPSGPDAQGNCCNKPRRGQLCNQCPLLKVRNTDPFTSTDAAHYMSGGVAQNECGKVLVVYWMTGKDLNPWEMMCHSAGTIDPDSCYWKRVGELRRAGAIEFVYDRLGNVVTRPGKGKKHQRVYRLSVEGELAIRSILSA